jgi:hypothetical protein
VKEERVERVKSLRKKPENNMKVANIVHSSYVANKTIEIQIKSRYRDTVNALNYNEHRTIKDDTSILNRNANQF